MNSWWELVLPTAVGGVFAILGSVITLFVERKRSAKALAAERADADARWLRERRRQVYSEFRREAQRISTWMAMYTRVGLESAAEPKEDWLTQLHDLRAEVDLCGSATVISCAEVVAAQAWPLRSGATGDMMRFDKAMFEYKNAVRVDLGINDPLKPEAWMDEIEFGTETVEYEALDDFTDVHESTD